MSDSEIPRWADNARALCRALLTLYAVLWLIRGVLAVADPGVFGHDAPTWLNVIVFGLFGAWIACGLIWLAGNAVAGYSEPRGR